MTKQVEGDMPGPIQVATLFNTRHIISATAVNRKTKVVY